MLGGGCVAGGRGAMVRVGRERVVPESKFMVLKTFTSFLLV